MSEDEPTAFDLPHPDEPRGWRERLDDLRRRWTTRQLAAGALLCAGVLVAAVALLRPAAPPPPVELSLPMASTSTPATAPSTTAVADVVAHATGAVVIPGVYRLAPGSRVTDLVAAAGGLAPDADSQRVNLAAVVHDGERVAVPRVGEPAPAVAAGGSGAETGSASSAPVNLNTATAAELEALPGLGPATAQAVVDDRTRNGPFRSVDDLQRVRGIGPAKLEQLHGLVTV